MRKGTIILLYLAGVLLGAALLAPPVYSVMQAAARQFPALGDVAGQPFHRYVSRCLMVLALAGLWPFLRAMGVGQANHPGLGLNRRQIGNLARGLLVGFGSLALLATGALLAGAREMSAHHPLVSVLKHLGNATLAAGAVGTLEEILFRAGVYGGLRMAYPRIAALAASSGVYALVHFFARPEMNGAPEWYSGFLVLGQMLQGFLDWRQLLPGFLNLFLAGWILALVYERTGSVLGGIGLHAGWIFWLKSYGFFTTGSAAANSGIWGSNKMIDGWLALAVLLACLPLAKRWFTPPRPAAVP